jgi:pimeloyl-ACP methyl ester carboxylesterase
MANIVLAHGILGFGSIFPRQPIEYFNGVKALYESFGHDVLCPSVPPLGSLDVRAKELERQIGERWKDGDGPIFALGHSMGGLDCRRVIESTTRLKGRFKRLITVATPHFGSPVATIVLEPPALLSFSPLKWVLDLFEDDAGALDDLQLRTTLQNQNVAGVEYLCIGCDGPQGPPSALFAATALVGGLSGIPNDGVVSLDSASHTNNAADLWERWPLDHGGAIGWPSGGTGQEFAAAVVTPPPEHLERYRSLLARLIA